MGGLIIQERVGVMENEGMGKKFSERILGKFVGECNK